jgi:transposase-like protein
MDPQRVFCPNPDCPASGQSGEGNIRVHSRTERRYRCQVCGKTFSGRQGTAYYRLRTDEETVTRVVTLLAYACPVAAIVQAFELDERTVANWWQRAGQQCRAVHAHVVTAHPLDLQQVQADEIRVRTQSGVFWMALAIMVSTRLWLGGAISARRDEDLIAALVRQVRQMALCRPLLLAVDGFNAYVTAFRRAFRSPLPRPGKRCRPIQIAWPDIHIVQVVKHHLADRLNIDRRLVQGTLERVAELIRLSQGQGGINTAYIERLNATFRQRVSVLTRRTRASARRPETLLAGMYVIGCLYNLCACHHSLRLKLSVGRHAYRWVPRTPALAAGLTDHRWSVAEVLAFRVPLAPWRPHRGRQGRWSKATHALVKRWCR